MKSNYKQLGDYIRIIDERNRDLEITNLLGVSISKTFIPSIANIVGTDLSNYKIEMCIRDRHYTGYLSAEKNKVVLGEQIQKVVESSVKSSEGRLSNQSFRMAVELAKLQRIIAYYFQMDEETLTELHNLCQREVKSMNGTLSLEDMIK